MEGFRGLTSVTVAEQLSALCTVWGVSDIFNLLLTRMHSYCRADWVTLIAQNAAVLAEPYVHDGAELEPVAVLCEPK